MTRASLQTLSCAALVGVALLAPSSGVAQDMNIALSRLRTPVAPGTACESPDMSRDWCQDDDAYRRVMTQFAGAMIPPILTPAGTRGVRGIYVGFETWLTPLENSDTTATGDAWFRAVEGDGMGSTTSRSRFVDDVLAWGRFNVRKGLPFGFELGTSVGYLANTSYWSLGLELRWALFEGFREDVGWIPDVAFRGAVQTLIGDGEFNVTVPSVDLILSEPIVIGSTVELVPSVMGQLAWVFVDSELVDLDPGTNTFDTCVPAPGTPTTGSGRPPYCTGSGRQLNHNIVFPSLRSLRARMGFGLQIRFQWFTLLSSFLFDVVNPSQLDSSLPQWGGTGEGLPGQWQLDLGVGLTL